MQMKHQFATMCVFGVGGDVCVCVSLLIGLLMFVVPLNDVSARAYRAGRERRMEVIGLVVWTCLRFVLRRLGK